ncbi:ribonuclease H-like domain-containing protein [Tanacetum coccineum]|uniref:Ribonuclease H-like domain-containing protein n=1 Tax=Tanacetum coccineum TaxID=301880 RepID=A0ABQ5ANL6_9ASTR
METPPAVTSVRNLMTKVDCTLSRYKARMMPNGSTQLEGVDVDDNFSLPIRQLDVKNAFLHGDLSETVYMHQPHGFWDSVHPDYVQGTDTAYLLLYVDDIVLTASYETLLQHVISSLHQEFSMIDLGSLNYFLSISVMRDSTGLFLSQCKNAVEILERAHMANCNPSWTPVDTESKLGDDSDQVSNLTLYQSLADLEMRIGLVFLLLGDRLQYHGVANAVVETCWLRNLLHELHTPLSSATLVYCDNVSAVYLSCNPVQHQCMKHIEIDIHFVQDLVDAGQVHVLHVPSRYQYADIFTKRLPFTLFEDFVPV